VGKPLAVLGLVSGRGSVATEPRVIVTREPLCPGCLSDGEVDFHINALKEQLELLRPKMKAEARRLREAPLELRTTPLDASDAV